MNRRTTLFLLIAVLLIPLAAAAASAPMRVSVEATAVTVSGVPSGGSVVLFSCSRSPHARSIAVKPAAIVLRDDDHDGVATYAPAGGVSLRSVWIAVDAASGETAAGAQADFPLLVSPIGADNLKKDVEGEIASMGLDLPRLSVLLVRPGAGAWMLTAFDGQQTDRDGHGDGRVELAFGDAATLYGKERAPKHLKKGDAVVAIDPGHLDVFIAQIEK